jgi:hypothetical protein
VTGGITWGYREDEDEDDDCEYRAILLGETTNVSVREAGKTPDVHYIFTLISFLL